MFIDLQSSPRMSLLEVITSCTSKIDFLFSSHNHGDQKCYLKTADARKGLETDYDFNSGKSLNPISSL